MHILFTVSDTTFQKAKQHNRTDVALHTTVTRQKMKKWDGEQLVGSEVQPKEEMGSCPERAEMVILYSKLFKYMIQV